MGAINIKHTGSGSDIALSSDGTSLLLDGTAIGGGGGGGDPDLYRDNASSATTPTASGTNAVAIGSGAVASGSLSFAFGSSGSNAAISSGSQSISMGSYSRAYGSTSIAMGYGAEASSGASGGVALGQNSRSAGNYAVGLANSRASGSNSFAAAISSNSSSYGATNTGSISIGNINKAAGYESFVAGGYSNTANNYRSSVLNGTGNTVSSNYGTILGGEANTINSSSNYSIILCGEQNIAGQQYTVASGLRAKTFVRGQWAHSAGHFTATGDAQSSKYVLRSDTTDATAEALTATNTSGGITNQVIAQTDAAVVFHGTVVAKKSNTSTAAAWEIKGLLVNDGGTTTLKNSAITVISNTPSWGLALSADNTNNALKVEATGASSTNIRWVATIYTSEVTYA